MDINIRLIGNNSKVPIKAHETDSGFDLTVDRVISESPFKIVYGLGVAIEFPDTMYGKIYSRSSIHKAFLWLANSVGIIDNSYRGELKAVFYKIPFISKPYKVGERCCQLIIAFRRDIGLKFNVVDTISETERGENGFGSTGK